MLFFVGVLHSESKSAKFLVRLYMLVTYVSSWHFGHFTLPSLAL
jgi:hypothetical protein